MGLTSLTVGLLFLSSVVVSEYSASGTARNKSPSMESAATFHTEVPAEPCMDRKCKLPDCFCSGTKPPKGLEPQNIPQFVMLTFDDSINPNVHRLVIALSICLRVVSTAFYALFRLSQFPLSQFLLPQISCSFYEKLFTKNRRNPNGCPIRGSFFVTHEWNDYWLAKKLYAEGHEIADHSITHETTKAFKEAKIDR